MNSTALGSAPLDADDDDAADVGALDKHVLDFRRRDVLTAADYGVVGLATDEQIAIFINGGHVFGREPALRVKR